MHSALGEHQHIAHLEAGGHHWVTLPHGLVHVQNPQLASYTKTLQYRLCVILGNKLNNHRWL